MDNSTDVIQYPPILTYLRRISTEVVEPPADIDDQFKVWQRNALRVLVDSCWDACYIDFHKALVRVVQTEEFGQLFEALYGIYNKVPAMTFPGVKIAEFESTSVWLKRNAFVVNEDGTEIPFELSAETEQQDIFEFSRTLKDSPRILNGMLTEDDRLLAFIQENVDEEKCYMECLPKAIELFAEALKHLNYEGSGMMEEVKILGKHDKTRFVSGFTVFDISGVKVTWFDKEVIVFLGIPMKAHKLKIADEDLAQQLKDQLIPAASSVSELFDAMPTSLKHLKHTIITQNQMPEGFEKEDTSPGT